MQLPKSLKENFQDELQRDPDFFSGFKDWMIESHLGAPDDQPFPSDVIFVQTLETFFSIKKKILACENMIQNVHLFDNSKSRSLETNSFVTRHRDLNTLLNFFDKKTHARIDAHEKQGLLKPRIVRLFDIALKLPNEMYALGYCVIAGAEVFEFGVPYSRGAGFGAGRYKTFDFNHMIMYSGLSFSEAVEFLSPSRLIVKHQILIPEESDPLQYPPAVPYTTISVLAGLPLTTEVRLKIEGTALSQILEQEQKQNSSESKEEISTSSDNNNNNNNNSNDREMMKQSSTSLRDSQTIFDFMREEISQEKNENSSAQQNVSEEAEDVDFESLTPYTSNVDYLTDHFTWLMFKIQAFNENDFLSKMLHKDSEKQIKARQLMGKEKIFRMKIEKRLELTKKTNFLPRCEKLARKMGLSNFEKNVVIALVANVLTHKVQDIEFTVGKLLSLFSQNFEEEIRNRQYFYKSSKLLSDSIIRLDVNDFASVEITEAYAEADRRMLDFIVGLDTEIDELVEGSHLYFPNVDIDQVILPYEVKTSIVEVVTRFDDFAKVRKNLGFDEKLGYGKGMMILFHGKSGTGKTMMANALAKKIGKKILLVNFPTLGSHEGDIVLRWIFREAKLTDSLLFFDECETLFQSRDKGASAKEGLPLLLTEIERHNGLIILATNRAYDLDEAMHRRITMAIEFRDPDVNLRKQIWKNHVPAEVKTEDINWELLATKYELTGGFIKNAVLTALSKSVSRDATEVVLKQEDLEHGASHQLRGRLAMVDFERRVVPTKGLESIIADKNVMRQLNQVINFEKSRQLLFSDWGFSEKVFDDQGTTVLLHGSPGTGKSSAAKAIGYEVGRPLKVVNTAQLVSKYVGETGKNIEAIFKEARSVDAVLVFEEAEALFGERSSGSSSTDKGANMDTGILLYHMEKFPGVVVLTTNLITNLDDAFFRRFRFIIEFTRPNAETRLRLWRAHIPERVPLGDDVDLPALAERFVGFSGANIKNVCFKAASEAILRPEKTRKVMMSDFVSVASEELKFKSGKAESSIFN